MVNAVCMASAFVANLPRHEMPETTDGHQGFFAPMSISGSIEKSTVNLLLRDFTDGGMEERKKLVEEIAASVAHSFGGKAEVKHTQQYLNMKKVFDQHPDVVKKLEKAYLSAGVKPEYTPIRGGTDGSRLTEMGIPTPNIFTGGHNFHSRSVWARFSQMIQAVEVLIQLASQWAKD